MNKNRETDGRCKFETRDSIPPSKFHVRHFLEWQYRNALQASVAAARNLGVDADYSPESLERLEHFSPQRPDGFQQILEWGSTRWLSNSSDQQWLVYLGMGAYFGEVLVRNLGGKWRCPNRIHVILALLLFRPGIAYRHWYVIVGKQKIPVVELARRRTIMGPDESLFRAYQTIANGAFKNYPQGPQYPGKKS